MAMSLKTTYTYIIHADELFGDQTQMLCKSSVNHSSE